MPQRRRVRVDGREVIVNPRQDLKLRPGGKVFLHYIPGAPDNDNGICYRLNGSYAVLLNMYNYRIAVRAYIRKHGVRSVVNRVPNRAVKIALAEAEGVLSEGREGGVLEDVE